MTEQEQFVPHCPRCGFPEKDFAKTLRLGCSECYMVFGAHLETMLPTMHRGLIHRGKRPQGIAERELAEIEHQLRRNAPGAKSNDELLDRWQKIRRRIGAGLNSVNPAVGNS